MSVGTPSSLLIASSPQCRRPYHNFLIPVRSMTSFMGNLFSHFSFPEIGPVKDDNTIGDTKIVLSPDRNAENGNEMPILMECSPVRRDGKTASITSDDNAIQFIRTHKGPEKTLEKFHPISVPPKLTQH